jgi:hypothetical protein
MGMETVLAAFIGGVLASAGAMMVSILSDRTERHRWRRDAQLRAGSDALSALQQLVRRMIDLAYLSNKEDETARRLIATHREATIRWNSAVYAALLVSPAHVAAHLPELDREVDRLKEKAMARPWTRVEFRQERKQLGRMAADYLNATRRVAGLSGLEVSSVWAWDRLDESP